MREAAIQGVKRGLLWSAFTLAYPLGFHLAAIVGNWLWPDVTLH